jgi:multiple sugar transport system substrate-binding protein
MRLNKAQAIAAMVIGALVLVFALGILGVIPGIKKGGDNSNFPTGKISLAMWGVGDSRADFAGAIEAYQGLHPNVSIEYREFDSWDMYEAELLDALAESRGPDIVMVKSSWTDTHQAKLYPLLPQFLSLNTFTQRYPKVVVDDFVREGQIWAMPLYMDTLALLYNQDMFDASAIAFAPTDWDGFVSYSSLLRRIQNGQEVAQAGTALGSASNVANMSDIVTMLMLQSGAPIISSQGGVRFDDSAFQALEFYLQFANPLRSAYTWNETLPFSSRHFAAGKVGMVLAYKKDLDTIKTENPFLNVGVAQVPQVNQYSPLTVADYAGLSVSRQAGQVRGYVAWDFIRTFLLSSSLYDEYLSSSQRLPATRTGLSALLNGEYDAFARSAFIARTWPKMEWDQIQDIFVSMIQDIRSGRISTSQALRAAQDAINRLY